MIISLATEFIENPKENASKQDCELTSFKRLAETLKKQYPRLPICLLAVGRITGKLTKTGIGNRRFGIQKNANKKKYLK